MNTITVMLNYLGAPVPKEYLYCLANGDHSGDHEYRMMYHVIGIPLEHLTNEVLERYVEVSNRETYIAIFPHTDKLFERLLTPLKSAKRMYCLGEYLASIELSAHLGEMLALLLWQITPVTINKKVVDASMEKEMWGSEFEKMGQDKRIKILKALDVVSNDDGQLFDYLRTTRRGYFHLWSTGTEKLKDDALNCFLKVAALVQSILKIEYENGTVKLNPLLATYLADHKTP